MTTNTLISFFISRFKNYALAPPLMRSKPLFGVPFNPKIETPLDSYLISLDPFLEQSARPLVNS